LAADWQTQDGQVVRLATMEGEPVVVAMIYTNCLTACPLTVSYLQRVERQLPKAARVRFVLVSLDGARDTPAALRTFAAKHRLTTDHWTMLTGAKADVRVLASALGVKFKADEGGTIAHTPLVVLLDRKGVVKNVVRDLTTDPGTLAKAAGRL
jgi:protein SCO1/2